MRFVTIPRFASALVWLPCLAVAALFAGCPEPEVPDCIDIDQDGYGHPDFTRIGCEAGEEPDCDDTDDGVHPGADELCDGLDNNCDGHTDGKEEIVWTDYHPDGDGDGYGEAGSSPVNACDPPADHVEDATDCDDSDPDVNPGEDEAACDGIDNDCDGATVDEFDGDGDGYDACDDGDCDDTDASVHPGADEVCDGVDNDCDGTIPADEIDDDGDGYDECGDGDCDDADETVYPGADEGCDGLDTDCDGSPSADETDDDGDGYSECDDDCDDADPDTYPGAEELCDGLDNDCDLTVPADEADGDGDGYTGCGGDCDDADAALNPGADEGCDGVDTDCDGVASPSETDDDGDGYDECADGDCDDGNPDTYPGASEQCDGNDNDCDATVPDDEADADADGYMICQGDCDDTDPAFNPDAPEICDGLDNDCDSVVPFDEEDNDVDGFMVCAGDCDDTDPETYPGAPELCQGADNDCDGVADNGCGDCDITVPGDQTYIQDAINAAANGQTICVEAGTYTENIDFTGKGIHVLGVDGPGATTIDGGGVDSVVVFDSGESSAAILEGFTLTGGEGTRGPNSENNGGGVYIAAASPTLVDLVITGNHAETHGGGLAVEGGAPSMSGVTIDSNSATRHGGGMWVRNATSAAAENVVVSDNSAGESGGGVYLVWSTVSMSDLEVSQNTAALEAGGIFVNDAPVDLTRVRIHDNAGENGGGILLYNTTATLAGAEIRANDAAIAGGGIAILNGSSATITNLYLVGNTAVEDGGGIFLDGYANPNTSSITNGLIASNVATNHYGGGVMIKGQNTPVFENVMFLANSAGDFGGAVVAYNGASAVFDRTVFVGNATSYFGGALAADLADSITLTNSVFAENNAGNSGGALYDWDGSATFDIRYCDFWDNSYPTFVQVSDPVGGEGNVDVDPQFMDTTEFDPTHWDLHLRLSSPLIDAGDPAVNDPDGLTSDIGAYGGPNAEFWDLDLDGYPEWWQPGPYDGAAYPAADWDCEDGEASIHPDAVDVPNDGIDQDCDGVAEVSECSASYTIPSITHTASMAYANGSLWVADEVTQQVYGIDPATGLVFSQEAGPGSWESGITHDGTDFWMLGYTDSLWKVDNGGAILGTYGLPETYHSGLAYDGTDLWLTTANGGGDTHVRRYSTSGVEQDVCTAARDIIDLEWMNGQLWATGGDGGAEHPYLYLLDDTCNELAAVEVSLPVSGLAYDGQCVWLMERNGNTLWSIDPPWEDLDGDGFAPSDGDCDDDDDSIHPDAIDMSGDGIDQDCDGVEGGLVAYWSFDEGTGTIATDGSGNGNDGTLYGATWAGGIVGNALESQGGGGSYVGVPDDPTLRFQDSDYTIEAWVLLDSYSINEQQQILCQRDQYQTGFGLFVMGAAQTPPSKACIQHYTVLENRLCSVEDISLGTWTHIAVTFDVANGETTLYLDGAANATATLEAFPEPTGGLEISRHMYSQDYGVDGLIDEVKIYSYIRSPDQIAADAS